MLISTVIRTYNREHLLARAVDSVLAQELSPEQHEVLVINDAGMPIHKADWQNDNRVKIYNTNRTNLAFAGNTGVALANGDYIHFLDDDDVALPGAYLALANVAALTNAAWIYGAYEAVDDDGKLLFRASPTVSGDMFALIVGGEGVPLGASLIKRSVFLEVGGLDHTMIPAEDRDLLMRISRRHLAVTTDHFIFRARVGATTNSTTKWAAAPEAGRRKREKIFCDPTGLRDILRSLAAQSDGRIYQRLARFYIGSAVRFAQHSPLTSISRLITAVRIASLGAFRRGFWQFSNSSGNKSYGV